MDRWNGGSPKDFLVVVLNRVVVLTELLDEAHELDINPGQSCSLTSPEFHRQASRIYARILRDSARQSLASTYAAAAEELLRRRTEVTASFDAVYTYLAGVSSTIGADAQVVNTTSLSSRTTSELLPSRPYPELAKLASRPAPGELRAAVAEVITQIGPAENVQGSLLCTEDIEIVRAVASGIPIVDIAAQVGWSERSLYRRLRDIWDHLGATNRAEGIAIASRLGLLA